MHLARVCTVEGLVTRAAAGFREKSVLVTGAAGFIGRRLTAALESAGARVTTIDFASIDEIHANHYNADIRDATAIFRIVNDSRPDYVFHLAAIGITNPFLPLDELLAVNLQGSINLFRACFPSSQPGNIVRLVNTGTPYEYGEGKDKEVTPINPYAASKAAAFAVARMLFRTEGRPIVTVRPFQVYGPGQPEKALIPAALSAIRSGRPFLMTPGEQQRDFIYVDDVVAGYLMAAASGVNGKSYDLGWGESRSIKEVINLLFSTCQTELEPVFGALPYRPGEVWLQKADREAAQKDLNWQPAVPLEAGLQLTAAYYL